MTKLNDFEKAAHFIEHPFVWLYGQVKGAKYKAPAEAHLALLGTPIVVEAEIAFKSEVLVLLTSTPSLSRTAVITELTPKADSIISGFVNVLKTSNPAVAGVEQLVIDWAESQVPALIGTAYDIVSAQLQLAAAAKTG